MSGAGVEKGLYSIDGHNEPAFHVGNPRAIATGLILAEIIKVSVFREHCIHVTCHENAGTIAVSTGMS